MARRAPRTGRRTQGKTSTPTKAQLRKEAQRQRQQAYRDDRKRVQPLVDFTIPAKWHPASAAKLKKYTDYLFSDYGVARGVKVAVRRKDKAKLEKLKARFGQGEAHKAPPGIKVAFVPTIHAKDDPDTLIRPIIRHRKGDAPDEIIYREVETTRSGRQRVLSEVTTLSLPFDKDALRKDSDAEVERLAAELMEEIGVDDVRDVRFRINNGASEMGMFTLDDMKADVRFNMEKYSEGSDELTDASHLWDRWMDSLTIEHAGTQKTLIEYDRTKRGEYNRRKKVGKIDLETVRLLKGISDEKRGGAMTERLAQTTTGTVEDAPKVRKALERMRKAKLVTGDDAFWMMTPKGRTYLKNAKSILPLYDL